MRHIYLDYNATTPIAPSVQEAMLPFLSEHYGNPSSGHAQGRACQEAIEDARGRVASLLGAEADEIIFTGGGSESNNLALKGVMLRQWPPARAHLIFSAIEHPSVSEPARFLARLGYEVGCASCDRRGVVDARAVEKLLRPETRLVSIQHANNEIGTVQPIREIAELCHARNVLVHTDAAQSAGKIRTHVDELEVDLLTLAGHKFYAPKGVGVLYVRGGVPLVPLVHGAGHEGGLRAGTENVASIVALGRAATLAAKAVDEAGERLAQLRDTLYSILRGEMGERLSINGGTAARLPNTLSINIPGVSAAELLAGIPELCASTGAACHAGHSSLSATLAAIGLDERTARGTMRLSVGWYTSEEDIERAAGLLAAAWERLRK